MATRLIDSNFVLTSNEEEHTYSASDIGLRHAIGIAGTWGGASVAIYWRDDAGNDIEYPDSPLTADGGIEVLVPARTVMFYMTGGTGSELKVTISRAR